MARSAFLEIFFYTNEAIFQSSKICAQICRKRNRGKRNVSHHHHKGAKPQWHVKKSQDVETRFVYRGNFNWSKQEPMQRNAQLVFLSYLRIIRLFSNILQRALSLPLYSSNYVLISPTPPIPRIISENRRLDTSPPLSLKGKILYQNLLTIVVVTVTVPFSAPPFTAFVSPPIAFPLILKHPPSTGSAVTVIVTVAVVQYYT